MRSDKSGSDSLRRKGCARRVRLMRGLRAEKSFISIYKAVFRCREAPGCPDYKCKQSFSELSQVQGLSPVGAAEYASIVKDAARKVDTPKQPEKRDLIAIKF